MNGVKAKSMNEKVTRVAAAALMMIMCAIIAASVMPSEAHAARLWNEEQMDYEGWGTPCFRTETSTGITYAYCLEAEKEITPNGTYGESSLVSPYGDTGDLKKSIYFGYGGPGHEAGKGRGIWSCRSWDGSSIDSKYEYYVISHIIDANNYEWDYNKALHGVNWNFKSWAMDNVIEYTGGGGTIEAKMYANTGLIPSNFYNTTFRIDAESRYQDVGSYKEVEYTLKVNPNGGTYKGTTGVTTMSPKLIYGSTNWRYISDPSTGSTATRTGYSLNGYYSAASGGTQVYTSAGYCVNGTTWWNDNKYRYAGDLTVNAQWTPNKYNISYNLNGGSYGTYHPTSATYDVAFTVSNPTRTGYQFAGWTITGLDSCTHTYGSKTTSAHTLGYIKETLFKNLRSTSGTVTYTAVWTPNTYYIVFNANGGSGSMSKMTCTYDKAYNLTANTFTRADWTFEKWNTNAAGTGTSYANKASVKNLTATNGATINLYAVWMPNITYVVDGDKKVVTNVDTITKGDRFTIPAARTTVATRANCHRLDGSVGFDGWYTDSAYTKKWTNGTAVDAPLVLYARNWASVTYKNGPASSESVTYTAWDTPGDEAAKRGTGNIAEVTGTPARFEKPYNTTLTLAEPTYKRVTFDNGGAVPATLWAEEGWHADAACTGAAFKSYTVTQDATVYKKWISAVTDYVDSSRK